MNLHDYIELHRRRWTLDPNPPRLSISETSNQQGKIERDYEPEQKYGTAADFQEHTRYGGSREDY